MAFWELDSIKAAVGGTWLARPAASTTTPAGTLAGTLATIPAARLEGCATDTRALKPGQVYVAIRGDRFDGNTFVAQAAAAGSPLAIIDDPKALPTPLPAGIAVLHVLDASLALLRLAGAYRKTLEGTRVIGVTGSNGKTTTTRLIQAVLSRTLRGTASIKSYNNRVGVPITILGAKRGDQFLICEVGTNALGEIAELAAVVQPDIVVVTSIGREHLEGLGSIRGAVSEAVALVNAVRPGGLVVMNADVPLLEEAVAPLSGATSGVASKGSNAAVAPRFQVIRFGFSSHADLRITAVEPGLDHTRFAVNDRSWHTVPLIGRHNALNAAAALAVARRLGVEPADADAGLTTARGAEMRLERSTIRGVHIINDAYNANPESMLAALETFAALPTPEAPARKVLILGDMLELGPAGPDAHREIGAAVANHRCFDLVLLVGPLSRYTADAIGDRALHVETLDAPTATRLAALLRPGDHVLLKGSRGMSLEQIIKVLDAHSSAANSLAANGSLGEVQIKSKPPTTYPTAPQAAPHSSSPTLAPPPA